MGKNQILLALAWLLVVFLALFGAFHIDVVTENTWTMASTALILLALGGIVLVKALGLRVARPNPQPQKQSGANR